VFDWDDLKVFLAAYRATSIGKAASQLGVSVSTVSRRLEALEQQLGVVLFARTPDGLVPEHAAADLLALAVEAEQVAARVEATARAARSRSSTVVRLATPPDLARMVLALALPRFFAAHPRIAIELLEGVDLSDMDRREADLAIRHVRPEHGDDLMITRLRETAFAVFASRAYLAELGAPPVASPARLRWVTWARPESAVERWLAAHVPGAEPALRCADPTTARLAAAHGVGACVLPRSLALATPGLQEVDLGLPAPPPATLWLIGHRAVLELPPVRRVWDFLVELLRDGSDAELAAAHAPAR
jgi:DNA-binding transcriptional LysR family regulator